MVTIKTTKEIRLEDFTGDFIVEEIERYWGYKWALVEEQKKVIGDIIVWYQENYEKEEITPMALSLKLTGLFGDDD